MKSWPFLFVNMVVLLALVNAAALPEYSVIPLWQSLVEDHTLIDLLMDTCDGPRYDYIALIYRSSFLSLLWPNG